MTNDELKTKIAAMLQSRPFENGPYGKLEIGYITALDIADALIAAGIGDVKEAEHRAEVAERALKHMASDYWGVECFCHGCYESGCRKSCGEKYLIFDEEDAVNCLVKNFLQQAEKELAEEGKDGKTDHTDR